jgi:uncharacterized membrane protein
MLISASAYSMFTISGKTVLKELDAVDVLLWRFFIAVPAAWIFIIIRHKGHKHVIICILNMKCIFFPIAL